MEDEPKIEDINKADNNNENKNNNAQSQELKVDYMNFANEFQVILNKSLSNSDNSLFKLIDDFKSKYIQHLISHPLSNEIELLIIEKMRRHKETALSQGSSSEFLQLVFDLYDLLPYLYHPDNFSFDNKSFEPKNDIDSIELFEKISPFDTDEMNKLIDELLIFLLNNYTDYKSLFIQNNLLLSYPSRSVFISFKFICIDIHLYKKMTQTTWNKMIYIESISNISRILLQEANYYNQKFNNEFYNNAFSEFEFNSEDKVKRKLSNEQFSFMTQNLFKFLYLIIKTFASHIDDSFNFCSIDSRKNYWSQVDSELKKEKQIEVNVNVYCWYIIMAFICDIIAFVYTNFLYFDTEMKDASVVHFKSTNPFKMFENDWKMPSYYSELISYMIDTIYIKHNSDNIKFIECFMTLCDIKSQFNNKITASYDNYSNATYYVFHPVNSLGLSLLIWIIEKESKGNQYLYSPLYLFDIHLPLIAALIKAEHNLRYIGFEMLLDFCKKYNWPIVPSMNSLMHYSFDDIFNDILDYIGGTDPEQKRKYINSQLITILDLLTTEAKHDLFNYYISTALAVSSDTKNINDAKVSYMLVLIKNVLNDSLKKNDKSIFKEDFLKQLISNFTDYEKIFIFEIIEIISQALNFIHYIILIDKKEFEGKLNIYNKDYLYMIDKKLTEIAKLVEKFVNSSDEEKYKTLRIDKDDQREEIQHLFNLRKNECLLLLNLLNTVGSLVMRSLKELNN